MVFVSQWITRRVASVVGAIAVIVVLLSCTEATSPARTFAVLDDVGSSNWASVTVGADHTCGLKSTGALYCWGSNQYGQLGIARFDTLCGTTKPQYGCSLTPQIVQAGVSFVSISAGSHHTCAITTAREAYCWGANDQNQVSGEPITGPTLIKVPGSFGWTQISAGYTHTCAVRTDGALYCWGDNDRGQIGNGTFLGGGDGPTRVPMPAPVAEVSAGEERTCARTTKGTVYCWGAVWTDEEDGLEMTRSQATPQLVPNAPAMVELSVGAFTTCGADISGFAYCWEGNPRGEMGTGTVLGDTMPQRVAGNLEFVQLAAGIAQSCGVVISGAGYCWGDNSFGQLGVSSSQLPERCSAQELPCATAPVTVFGRQQFVQISTGFGSHTCGVTVRGNLYCWGLGISGQLGNGAETYAISVPVLVVEPKTP